MLGYSWNERTFFLTVDLDCTLLLSSGVVASFARVPSVTYVRHVSLGLLSDQLSVRTMISLAVGLGTR